MLTRRIDAALNALSQCNDHVPFLRDQYRPNAPERAALDAVLAALSRANDAMRQGSEPMPPAVAD